MTFTSEIVRCNVPNKNGHVYTKECIEKSLENPIIKEQIENGCFFGGFMEDYKNELQIDISKVSHVCKELWWEDNILYGKFETLDTPMGQILEQTLHTSNVSKENCMSISGYGFFDRDGVAHSFNLIGINFTGTNKK